MKTNATLKLDADRRRERKTYRRACKRALARLRKGMDLRWTTARFRNEIHEDKECRMPREPKHFDLYTFVAGAALESGKVFPLECNCGGVVTIMPPFQDEFVVCPRCESRIKMLVIEGDPGYVIGADPDGTSRLLPVQGSASPHPGKLSAGERDAILAQAKESCGKGGNGNGDTRRADDVGRRRRKTPKS